MTTVSGRTRMSSGAVGSSMNLKRGECQCIAFQCGQEPGVPWFCIRQSFRILNSLIDVPHLGVPVSLGSFTHRPPATYLIGVHHKDTSHGTRVLADERLGRRRLVTGRERRWVVDDGSNQFGAAKVVCEVGSDFHLSNKYQTARIRSVAC